MLSVPAAGTSLTTSVHLCMSRELQGIPLSEGPGNPPIITHTAATPMATPQGSPNEMLTKDTNNKLSVSRPVLQRQSTVHRSTLSVESSDRSVVSWINILNFSVHIIFHLVINPPHQKKAK